MHYRLYASDVGSWRYGWDVGATMPSNQLDGPRRRRKRKERMNRDKMMKRRSKWSSVPPSCRTHHTPQSSQEGHLDHTARELLLRTRGLLPISLVLLRVGRGKLESCWCLCLPISLVLLGVGRGKLESCWCLGLLPL